MQQYTHENVRSIPHLPIYCDRYEDYRQFSPRHWHDHIEIIYVVSGSLQVVCGENEYTLQENEFFVINSNKIHGNTPSTCTNHRNLHKQPLIYHE